MAADPRTQVLKLDALGRVERAVRADGSVCARRVASGSRIPFSAFVARRLLARERAALRVLDGLDGVPRVDADRSTPTSSLPSHSSPQPRARSQANESTSSNASARPNALGNPHADARVVARFEVRDGAVLERSWIDGLPLSRAEELPEDFFDLLDSLVQRMHARGVCHNDLHKEQNVLVRSDGRPALVDFQLASVHPARGRLFASRAREDLRHVEKHRRRYTRLGRGPRGDVQSGAGDGIPRSFVARAWRNSGKPLYVFVTRRVLRTRDGAEERRDSSGPWPRWTPAIGAKDATGASDS